MALFGRLESPRIAGPALFAMLVMLTATTWSFLVASRCNTLEAAGRWISAKAEVEKGLIGGITSRVTRPILHRNRLDLGAWFAYQEVHRSEAVDVRRCAFSFRLAEDAHISVLFAGGSDWPATARGFTLSRCGLVRSKAFRLDGTRMFERSPGVDVGVLDEAWHRAGLEFGEDSCTLSVDGREIARVPVQAATTRRIGFRGGAHQVLVDDVEIEHRDGTVWHERFDRHELVPGLLLVIVPIAFAVAGLAFGLARSRGARARRSMLVAMATIVTLGCVGVALLALDHFVLSARYPADRREMPGRRNTMFDVDVPARGFRGRFPDRAGLPRTRVLFLGGSQTWGSGATLRRDTWTYEVERRLNAALPERGIEIVNRAMSGHDSADIVRVLDAGLLEETGPDWIVVNASHNDYDVVVFGQNLVRVWERAKAHGARLVFVLEANSPEDTAPHLFANHEVMRVLAAGGGVPVIDAHSAMATRHDTGFLWWDIVHLTSAGQGVLAAVVALPLAELMR